MFSSFVQNLAAPHPRQSSESAPDARPASPARNRSSDGHSSTGQLAESALSNLRKSLASQRPASPSQSQKSPPLPRAHKMTLEDRLKAATFTIGETSGETTPAASSRVSPVPPPVDKPSEAPETAPKLELTMQHPLSPSSTPLPESRVTSPIELHKPAPILVAPPSEPVPLPSEPDIPLSEPPSGPVPLEPVPTPSETVSSPPEPVPPSQPPSEPVATLSPKPQTLQVDQVSALEAEVALSHSTPDAQGEEAPRINDVDALQERLKLVEQRFSGG